MLNLALRKEKKNKKGENIENLFQYIIIIKSAECLAIRPTEAFNARKGKRCISKIGGTFGLVRLRISITVRKWEYTIWKKTEENVSLKMTEND